MEAMAERHGMNTTDRIFTSLPRIQCYALHIFEAYAHFGHYVTANQFWK